MDQRDRKKRRQILVRNPLEKGGEFMYKRKCLSVSRDGFVLFQRKELCFLSGARDGFVSRPRRICPAAGMDLSLARDGCKKEEKWGEREKKMM